MAHDDGSELSFEFELDAKSTYEGMMLGGARVYRGRGKALLFAQYFELLVCVPFGFMAIYVVVTTLLMDGVPNAVHWLLLTGLLGLVFGGFINKAAYQRLAKQASKSAFGRAGTMQFDVDGVVLTTRSSEWHTGWQDIEEIMLGKRSIGVAVSGIVLILPLSAFVDELAMERVFMQVNKLFEQGRDGV